MHPIVAHENYMVDQHMTKTGLEIQTGDSGPRLATLLDRDHTACYRAKGKPDRPLLATPPDLSGRAASPPTPRPVNAPTLHHRRACPLPPTGSAAAIARDVGVCRAPPLPPLPFPTSAKVWTQPLCVAPPTGCLTSQCRLYTRCVVPAAHRRCLQWGRGEGVSAALTAALPAPHRGRFRGHAARLAGRATSAHGRTPPARCRTC